MTSCRRDVIVVEMTTTISYGAIQHVPRRTPPQNVAESLGLISREDHDGPSSTVTCARRADPAARGKLLGVRDRPILGSTPNAAQPSVRLVDSSVRVLVRHHAVRRRHSPSPSSKSQPPGRRSCAAFNTKVRP